MLTRFFKEAQKKFPTINLTNISISLNIDGISPFKSSKYGFWAILYKINIQYLNTIALPLALCYGRTKPEDLDFLIESMDSIEDLITNGLNGIRVSLKTVVCDAPALSFVKGIVQFNGRNGCGKCRVSVQHKMSRPFYAYSDVLIPRTDIETRACQETNFVKITPFSRIKSIDLVNDFITDAMHCVYLGVVKALIKFLWVGSPCGIFSKINQEIKNNANNLIIRLRKSISNSYFARKPRILEDIDRWKAAESRVFLLYLGIIVFELLPETLYHHFLLLSTSIAILENIEFSNQHSAFAEKCLKLFMQKGEYIYGSSFMSYNVHSLLHLVNDVERYGTLTDNSAFCFESFNSAFRYFIRARKSPLTEFVNRFNEKCSISFFWNTDNNKKKKLYHYIVKGNCLTVTLSDLMDKNLDIIPCKSYLDVRPLHVYPCDSRIIGRYKYKKENEEKSISKKELIKECIRLDIDDNSFAFIQLLHK